MTDVEVDEIATRDAISRYGLPACLHIPIAARDESAIPRFIGRIAAVIRAGTPNQALLVHPFEPREQNARLRIWRQKEAAILHHAKQVWVHVDYPGYRGAYAEAFPNEDLTGLVLDHVLNRRAARLRGFRYVRIVPISRGANSSSGGLCEKWGVEYQRTGEMVRVNRDHPAFLQYADLADLVKMLNMKTGGFLQDGVNEAQALLQED